MTATVKLSYEERIINALARVEHRRGDDALARAHRDAEAIREVLASLYRERDEALETCDRLHDALTVWCRWCWPKFDPRPADARPAVLTLSWSDRACPICVEHVADEIVNIALDHYYDREGLRVGTDLSVAGVDQHHLLALPPAPTFEQLRAHVERGCAAARAWLDEIYPDWHYHSVDGMGDESRAELLGRVRAALAEPTP